MKSRMSEWANSWSKAAATEHPKWRRSKASTSFMMSEIERYIAQQEKTESRRERVVEDFVFNVNSNEGEGSDTVKETRHIIANHRVNQIHRNRLEWEAKPPKKLSNDLEQAAMDKAKADVNLYDAYTLLVEEWRKEDKAENGGVPGLRIKRIKQLHFVLFHDRDFWEQAGEYRKEPVYIGLPDGSFIDLEPHQSISKSMEELIGVTNTMLEDIFCGDEASKVKRLIYLACAFFIAYENIHPFIDGNGRTGRLLLAYLLGSVTPSGPNNFYLHQECGGLVLSDRWDYLSCFRQQSSDVQHPWHLIALVVEGIFVQWKFFASGNSESKVL